MSERPAVPPVSGAIYGIGTDIIQIERVEGVMQRTHGRFAEKVLGPDELRIYQARKACSSGAAWRFLPRALPPRRRSPRPSASACTGR